MDVEKLHKLTAGSPVKGTYLVRTKSTRQAKNGPYLSFSLGDRHGHLIEARQWQVSSKNLDDCHEGDIVDIQAVVEVWNGSRQLKIASLSRTSDKDLSPMDYLPKTKADVEGMLGELKVLIEQLENHHLRALMTSLFSNQHGAGFAQVPASKLLHQARLGGLLEHTLGVSRLCRQFAALYAGMDVDLLICGALCHDLGKTSELSAGTLTYTTDGKLLGHTVLGLLQLQQRIAEVPDFPVDLARNLLHLVASHSGKLEWGAPAKPHTLEAWALHLADMVDSRLSAIQDSLNASGDGEWIWNELVDAEVWRPHMSKTPEID